ncbi:methyltransferase domain-containing protein [Methylosinus sp. H3A]|uniref:methyltransferase domain-containing protein n=1 Tax=Methylosinus sp. H3A TaxID=2785786 RepID=UPI0018C34EEE|nr:methyltransferase domain-containing protein [Methylosinus sp. H3A]MBG0808518.1 methyltransferase domain-containing protein [Methylosinus sp. H3A]
MNIEAVKDYYGKTLRSSDDLKTMACCTPDSMPARVKALLSNIHDEVLTKYYGCGLVAPEELKGRRVLDLGCGSGRDVYLMSQLVGPSGEVVGVDMTPEQLETATAHIEWHRERFGYARNNVRFLHGYIERLDALGLERASFDVIVSNCVVNLSIDKPAVLKGAFDLLKPGGEFHFADVYADRRLDPALRNDPVVYGECLGGALYWGDFLALAKAAGFGDPRLAASRPLEIIDSEIEEKIGAARFYSATYRLFKIEGLEPACEDYGQAVIYRGGVPEAPHRFTLDSHHVIEKGRLFPVCGNSWRMLKESRFAPYFDFLGDFSTHFGIFPGCGTNIPFTGSADRSRGADACC